MVYLVWFISRKWERNCIRALIFCTFCSLSIVGKPFNKFTTSVKHKMAECIYKLFVVLIDDSSKWPYLSNRPTLNKMTEATSTSGTCDLELTLPTLRET